MRRKKFDLLKRLYDAGLYWRLGQELDKKKYWAAIGNLHRTFRGLDKRRVAAAVKRAYPERYGMVLHLMAVPCRMRWADNARGKL